MPRLRWKSEKRLTPRGRAFPDDQQRPSLTDRFEHLTAFYRGDHSASVVADDFVFEGPFVKVAGRDAFFASAQGLRPFVHGHRLRRRWRDSGEVCSIYESTRSLRRR